MDDPLLLRVLDDTDARQLPVLIAEWAATADHRRWIARALRLDLALLTARPELAVACLYRRCALAGDPVAEDGFVTRPPAPPGLDELRAWIRGAVAGARRPWLRALRTPPVPLDGAAIEEYRTSARGTLWADGERIGVADAIAWERATGRRVSAHRDVPPPPARWMMSWRDSTWGRAVLERGDERVTVAHSEAEIVRSVDRIDDRHVLFNADYYDDELHGVIDTRSAAILWTAEGRAPWTVPLDDDHLLLARDRALATVAIRTGELVSSWDCPYTGELVALPGGDVAIRTGAVIRIWDRGEAQRAQVQPLHRASWVPMAFSPDGARLITGATLCDARTGAAIAQLRCNSPGWLEGGPPPGCQQLCDGVFGELQPFGFTTWNTDDGRELLNLRDLRASFHDAVAFDPTGHLCACWRADGRLAIHRMRDGALVRELAEPPPARDLERKLGFSADGALLVWDLGGSRRAVAVTGAAAPRELAHDPREAPIAMIDVIDGVLSAGGAAIACDDDQAVVSRDGSRLAGRTSHCALES